MSKKRSLLRFPPQSFVTALQANGSFFALLPPEQLHSAERFPNCLLCDQSTAYYVWWSWPKSSKSRHIFSKWVWNFQIRDQVEKVNPWLGHINCASRVKKNTLQKDKTASWPSNPICVLICGRRSQHLVNIVNSLQIYMSKPTLFCRNRSLPASFGA